jgi:hypothetical protein
MARTLKAAARSLRNRETSGSIMSSPLYFSHNTTTGRERLERDCGIYFQRFPKGIPHVFAEIYRFEAILENMLYKTHVHLDHWFTYSTDGREDDMAAGFYRPASVARLCAAIDAQGKPTMLKVGIGSPSIMAASGFMKIPDSGVDEFAMEGIADHPYDIPNQRIAYGRREAGPQVWLWRSVGHSQNLFFIEGFIDELAAAAKKDPFEFRRALLTQQPRYKGVLEAAAPCLPLSDA